MNKNILLGALAVVVVIGALSYFYKSNMSLGDDSASSFSGVSRTSSLGINPDVRYELLNLLKTKRFSQLDEKLESYAKQLEQDEINEFDFDYAYISFSVVEPSLDSLLKEWISTTNSWASKFAYANYLYNMAWEWRGSSFWRSVPEINRENFESHMQQAQKLAASVVDGNKNLSESEELDENEKLDAKKNALVYDFLISVANDSGVQDEEDAITTALNKFPQSESIHRSAIRSSAGRWGGDQFVRAKLITDLNQIISTNTGKPETGIVEYYNAHDAYKNKNYVTAIDDYKRAIDYNPDSTLYYLGLSDAYFQSRQYEQALEAINVVVADWSSSGNIRLKRAQTLVRLKRLEEAEKDIKLALEMSPFDAKLNKLAGELYGKLGKKQRAIQALEASTYFKKESSDWWGRIGMIAQNDLNDYALAQKNFKKALEITPYDVRSTYGLSTIYGRTSSCEIVQSLHDYMTGCQRGVGKTRTWCGARYMNWARSSVNHLQGSQSCPEISEFDFTTFN